MYPLPDVQRQDVDFGLHLTFWRESVPETKETFTTNRLLGALPRKDYERLLPALEPIPLAFGTVLTEPGDRIRHVYFPVDSLVSLLTMVDSRKAAEVGLIGSEGMVGLPVALGVNISPIRAVVQGSGTAVRMDSARFSGELRRIFSLQRELLRFTHSLMAQISQTAACNRFHTVGQRLARWLLMTRDRVRSNQFRLTHEFLAHMLGVRRVGVTQAASALQQRKLIRYSRGNITILDEAGLVAAACTCYEAVKTF